MLELKYELLFDIVGTLDESQNIGNTSKGVRVIAPVSGGSFKGPKLNGKVLPFGADWLMIRSDGVYELDVRITLETDDGALIYAYYRGIIEISPEVYERIFTKGEDVDPSEYYFRTTPVLETGSEKYEWLNNIICVGVGKLSPGKVEYKVYHIL
jgi:hypothetical protein